jgi:hypothetical protein
MSLSDHVFQHIRQIEQLYIQIQTAAGYRLLLCRHMYVT